MTKYILAGGEERKHDDYGRRLAAEVYKDLDRPVSILSCFFGRPKIEAPARAKAWEEWFKRYFGDDVVYAYATPTTFMAQIGAADVVYLHGGDNELLISTLKTYKGLAEAFQGKVVVGSSAGAYFLTKNYWGRSKQKVGSGSGIIPVGVVGHYGSDEEGGPKTDWSFAEEQVAAASGTKPILIREGEFTVIEQ